MASAPPIRCSVTLTALSIVTYALCYFALDIPIAEYFHRQPGFFMNPTVATVLSAMVSKWVALLSFLITAALWFFNGKALSPRTARAVRISCLTIFISLALSVLLKILIGRYRPEVFFESGEYGFAWIEFARAQHSSPSGHTTRAFALIFSLATFIRCKQAWAVFCLFAMAAALSRLVLEQHYLGDLVFGAYLSTLVFLWCRYWVDHQIEDKMNELDP